MTTDEIDEFVFTQAIAHNVYPSPLVSLRLNRCADNLSFYYVISSAIVASPRASARVSTTSHATESQIPGNYAMEIS
jgi:hypothetical protein